MKTGINLRQFVCLAICNRLQVQLYTAVNSNEFLSQFRDHVMTSVRSEDTVLTGSGHFSPLGAWHRESDRVLIMDVARFKYPPHWVELRLLMEAMCTVDDSTGRPRGYFLLSLDKGTMAPVVFRFKQNAVCSQPECTAQLAEWRQFLSNDRLDDDDQELRIVAETFTRLFSRFVSCCQSMDPSCCREQLTIENGDTAMAERLKQCKSDICKTIGDTVIAGYFNDPAAVALLLAWPFELEIETKRCGHLRSMVDEQLDKLNPETRNEVNVLHRQIAVIVQCRTS